MIAVRGSGLWLQLATKGFTGFLQPLDASNGTFSTHKGIQTS
jgi:hypothetical protein